MAGRDKELIVETLTGKAPDDAVTWIPLLAASSTGRRRSQGSHQSVADVNYIGGFGAGALYLAMYFPHRCLFAWGDTPLLSKLVLSFDLVRLLLDYGRYPNTLRINAIDPLHTVASLGWTAIVAILLEFKFGTNVNSKSESEGLTPLIEAAKGRCADTVRLLLDHGADVNVMTEDHRWLRYSRTGLRMTARYRHPQIIELLLQRGADLQIQTKDGETA